MRSRPPWDTAAPATNGRWAVVGAAAIVLVAIVAPPPATWSYDLRGAPTQASGRTVLPFTGTDFRLSPSGVAVDSAGNVYVTSENGRPVVKKLIYRVNRHDSVTIQRRLCTNRRGWRWTALAAPYVTGSTTGW